ncbi:uncharacterized protein ACNLHF_014893 isoform 3-T3 [Anomaloglossus baeobatrachus]
MTAVRKAILTTLLLYLLTSQEKVYSDVLLNEKIEDLTCNVQEHNRIAYKYDGEFFQRTDKVYEHASDGGIFTCERNKSNPTPPGNVSCESHIIVIVLSISENVTPTVIKEKVGQSISFQTLVHNEATANPCCGSPTEGNDQEKMQKETPSYIIAGSVGGFFVVLATLLLAIFFIKKKAGNQMKMSRSSPVGPSEEYECMPYAVSERKEEIPNHIYSLAQNPVITIDSEYSELQVTNTASSGVHCSKSNGKANISDGKHNEDKKEKIMKEEGDNSCTPYSVVNINTR